MYEIFSENSINILMSAQDEARKANKSEVDPINLFIALIQKEKSSASKILSQHMIKKFSNTYLKNKDVIMNFSRKLEIGFNSEVKTILSEAVKDVQEEINKNITKSRLVSSLNILKAILNSNDKNLNNFFQDKNINSEIIHKEIISKQNNQFEDDIDNKEDLFKQKIYLESLTQDGLWKREGTFYDISGFRCGLEKYISTGIVHRLVDTDNKIVELFDSKYVEIS